MFLRQNGIRENRGGVLTAEVSASTCSSFSRKEYSVKTSGKEYNLNDAPANSGTGQQMESG